MDLKWSYILSDVLYHLISGAEGATKTLVGRVIYPNLTDLKLIETEPCQREEFVSYLVVYNSAIIIISLSLYYYYSVYLLALQKKVT